MKKLLFVLALFISTASMSQSANYYHRNPFIHAEQYLGTQASFDTIVTTATIGGASSGTLVLKICPTNSNTAGDWVEIDRFTNGQSITLAIVLQSVQTIAGSLNGYVPAGYYRRVRSINNNGTPSFTYNSGQEVPL